jgi:hypothetical protein
MNTEVDQDRPHTQQDRLKELKANPTLDITF